MVDSVGCKPPKIGYEKNLRRFFIASEQLGVKREVEKCPSFFMLVLT